MSKSAMIRQLNFGLKFKPISLYQEKTPSNLPKWRLLQFWS